MEQTDPPAKVASNDQLGVGADVWVFGGYATLPTRGTVTQLLHESNRPLWGVRVKTVDNRDDGGEHGRIYGLHAVFLRPQQKERLLARVMDAYDALSDAADKLANDEDA